ncbi:DUF234 domain-containing protein [Sulfurovum riftiae]|uniref:ATPase n=1 Tax=Sulfurovum riftiae TaxID=1630136 RepID=A0A151CIE1_9BACT|nr:DUF234 domain-containing protein [Sulfurovum riftiae]KYJ87023.1 ATPase [Sulfurovum riftiae]
MSKHPTLLQHFRSFAYQNDIRDFDTALEYFAVFGGTGWEVDTAKSVETLMEEKILRNYEPLHQSITRYTHNNPVYHRLLTIIALGTEHEHDAFKKAKIGRDRGEEAIDYLEQKSLLRFDLSVEEAAKESERLSDRLLFRLPFMRFWFAAISPYYQSISAGDYREFKEKWQELKGNFSIVLSNLLIRELVVQRMAAEQTDDPVTTIGSYYDKKTRIELLAVRKSGKMLAGECKYSRKPAEVHMLSALKEKCQKADLDIAEYVLFSKHGFSAELEQMKGADVTLLSHTHLSSLLDHLTKEDLLVYTNRKY